MFIDAHAHVDRFEMVGEGAVDAALEEINERRIFTISNSMDIPSYEKNLAISKRCKWILPIFGVHPWNASECVDQLDSLIPHIKKSSMIGEIGLDFFFVKDEAEYPNQITVFEYLLSAAKAQNKIVHLHTKGAEEEVYKLLERYTLPRVLVHWYSGPIETLKKYIDMGVYFTVGVEINYTEHVKRIAELVPLNRMLTETDNPGGPKMYLGEPGKPSLILEVIKSLASLKGKGEREMVQIIKTNLIDLIGDDTLLERLRSIF